MIECDPRLLEIFERSFKKNIFFPFGHFSSSKNVSEKFDNILYSGSLTKYYRRNEKDFNVKPYLKTFSSLDNKISLDECISRGQQVTRNYVKRQNTWWNSSNLEIFQKFDNFPAEIDVKSIKIE